ncbi:MAG TPA: peptidoglycan DD-metalloendopeptidase family protein [Longimicrobiaceae bacterium]|nr:peptidoglycan DD-metalloendopeptidase family protein [Longimicrobiaceae bacterium]
MSNPYRFLALGLFAAVGVATAGSLVHAPAEETPPPPPPLLLPVAYANPAEVAFQDTLQRGETLSELLQRSRLAAEEAAALLAELQGVQDPRALRAGAVISYRKSFTRGEVRGMEFNLDADRTLTVRRSGDAWDAAVEEVPVRTDTAALAGEVRSSLYQALMDAEGADVPREERERIVDVVADKIFAWQIDFSRDLRPGDSYRILYERQVRPDGTARSWRVIGALFDLSGREHSAFWYRLPDGTEDYYARDGGSLRRAFLRAPLEFRRISSAFSTARFHPILKKARPHNGIDYAAAAGTPIRAVGDGVVAKAGWGGGYGNVVEIRHSRGYTSRYAHMRGFASGIRPGVRVRQGDLIGYVGSTGLSTGPHLHYEFHENGRPINPSSIKYLTGDPVPAGARARYRTAVSAQLAKMEQAASPVRYAEGDRSASAAKTGD